MDYSAQRWSLKVDGTNVVSDFGFYSAQAAFNSWAMHDDLGTGYVDQIQIALTNFASGGQALTPYEQWLMRHYNTTNINAELVSSNNVNSIRQMYIMGLNPTNNWETLEVTNLNFSAGGPQVLRWGLAATGRLYSVWWSSNLLQGFDEVPVVTNLPHTQTIFTDTLHGAQQGGFYRIGVNLE